MISVLFWWSLRGISLVSWNWCKLWSLVASSERSQRLKVTGLENSPQMDGLFISVPRLFATRTFVACGQALLCVKSIGRIPCPKRFFYFNESFKHANYSLLSSCSKSLLKCQQTALTRHIAYTESTYPHSLRISL